MGGGNRRSKSVRVHSGGLSPRGRGKRGKAGYGKAAWRSIPAWAGETLLDPVIDGGGGVYPRVGGGNAEPRASAGICGGLSPRGRGKRSLIIVAALDYGSIPAWAGETDMDEWRRQKDAVYPRVGGGNSIRLLWRQAAHGLSPRGRGKPSESNPARLVDRSIPAWAGETILEPGLDSLHQVYPRVGGGNTSVRLSVMRSAGLSPRGRGKRMCRAR